MAPKTVEEQKPVGVGGFLFVLVLYMIYYLFVAYVLILLAILTVLSVGIVLIPFVVMFVRSFLKTAVGISMSSTVVLG